MVDDDTLMTLEEVADRLRISRRHLTAIRSTTDAPPVIRLGRRVFVRRSTLDAWLRDREAGGKPDAPAA